VGGGRDVLPGAEEKAVEQPGLVGHEDDVHARVAEQQLLLRMASRWHSCGLTNIGRDCSGPVNEHTSVGFLSPPHTPINQSINQSISFANQKSKTGLGGGG